MVSSKKLSVTRREIMRPEATINLNYVFDQITRDEGGEISVSRAQVGEVCSLFLSYLRTRFAKDPASVVELLQRSRN
jgi:hypothetical protein